MKYRNNIKQPLLHDSKNAVFAVSVTNSSAGACGVAAQYLPRRKRNMLSSSFLPLVSSVFRAVDSVDVRLLFWLLFLQPSCNYAILSTTFTSEICLFH